MHWSMIQIHPKSTSLVLVWNVFENSFQKVFLFLNISIVFHFRNHSILETSFRKKKNVKRKKLSKVFSRLVRIKNYF